MENINLKVNPRDLLGKKVKKLRGKNQIPAVLYGRNFASISLSVDLKDFMQVSKEASESTLIDLNTTDNKSYKALIRGVQKDPVTSDILHIDFYKVDMTQKLETEIPLTFVGESLAVKDLEGNFITNKDTIRVECLPDKLVSEIEVDISPLKTFEDLIRIQDLKIPEGIEVLEEPEDIIAQVTAPLSEEELKAMEEEEASTTEKAQIETIEAEAEKEKAEKAEGEEGSVEAPTEEPADSAQEKKPQA